MRLVCILRGSDRRSSVGPGGKTLPRNEIEVLETRHGATLAPILPDWKALHPLAQLWSIVRLWRPLLQAHRDADVLLLFSEDVGFPVAALLFVLQCRRPMLIMYHGHASGSKKNRLFVAILRRFGHVHWLPIAQSLAERLAARGVHADRIHNIGYFADAAFYAAAADRVPDIPVCSAGLAHRDYRTLIEACKTFDIPVRIAADSAYFQVGTEIADLLLPPNIEVSSAGDFQGLRDVYARSELIVVPMHNVDHACGYAVLYEAMACGKPIIATRTRAPSDGIVHGVTGWLVPPSDPAALRHAIKTLRADRSMAQALGHAARLAILRNDTVELFTDRIYAISKHLYTVGNPYG